MRKIILNLALSLDGFIEGPNGEYDWCFTDQDYGMEAFFNSVDTILIGRKSYELVKSMDDDMYKPLKMYVFSKTLETVGEGETLITNDFEEEVRRIKQLPGKDIWLFGGANLTTSFMNANLIDEFLLSIHPIVLGKGKPLFIDINDRTVLNFKEAKTFSSGLVQLFYTR